MIFILFIYILLIGGHYFQTDNTLKMKSIERNGMIIQWKISDATLHVEATAPTLGWIAVGLNTQDELTGTQLIMGYIKNGIITLEEHYIRRPGDHVSVLSIGGKNAILDFSGQEFADTTRIKFKLPLKAIDEYHLDLQIGRKYYLLMAFSVEDDFDHHSRMRTTVLITL